MLILSSDRAQRCQVSDPRPNADGTLEAIIYRSAIYIFINRYSINERKSAMLAARELLDADRFCLLLQEQAGFTLWELTPWVQVTDADNGDRAPAPAEPAVRSGRPTDLAAMDLAAVVAEIHRSEPPLIRDRHYRLRMYPRVFVGQEAVKWFIGQFNLPRSAAIRLGQRLLDEGLARHVTGEHRFEDRFLFYRFLADEEDITSLQETIDVADAIIQSADALVPAGTKLKADTNADDFDLAQLVEKMRAAKNLIGNRRYMLRVYPHSFVGYEAADWLVANLGIPRVQAIRLGQRLLKEGWIRHVTNDHQFEDRYLFYEFLDR